jgi:hypothetical protein
MPGVERLRDGYPTTINLSGAGVTFWEKTVQPIGIDGGEPIDTTTMRNESVRTKAPRHLYDVTPIQINAAYDPTVYTTILAQININQQIVTTMPDGATITWWGYLQKFIPEVNEEGKEPMAAITLVPTNVNASDIETIPVLAAGSGTGA